MSFDAPFGCGDPPPAELYAEIWRRHGHRCPMSTLGGRLGHAARRRLGTRDVRACYRIATCAVDGIAVASGCALTDGTLTVVEEDKHQLLVTAVDGGVTLELRPETLARAAVYRRCDDALERERTMLDAAVLQRRLAEREALLDELLAYLCSAPEAELLRIEETPGGR